MGSDLASEVEAMKRALSEQIKRANEKEAELARLRRAYLAAVRSLCERHWALLAASRARARFLRWPWRRFREQDVVRESIFFDPVWYAAQYSDARKAGGDAARHYCRIGAVKNFSPGPAFSAACYLEQNPDVAGAGIGSLLHFEIHGRAEGRRVRPPELRQDIIFRAPPVARDGVFRRALSALRQRYKATPDELSYREWVERFDTLTDEDRGAIQLHIQRLGDRPRFSILLSTSSGGRKLLRATIASIRRQLYTDWELFIIADASTSRGISRWHGECRRRDPRIVGAHSDRDAAAAANRALKQARGAFVTLLPNGCLMAEQALYEAAVEANRWPEAQIIYSDHDWINRSGRRSRPFFKTDWNPELALAFDMVNPLGCFRRSLVEAVGGFREGFADVYLCNCSPSADFA